LAPRISPDRDPQRYIKVVNNYQQIRKKLRKLDDNYIDNTNNKQVFKEIRDILIDIRQLLKNSEGIRVDHDVEAP
jgi:hypothetical protein